MDLKFSNKVSCQFRGKQVSLTLLPGRLPWRLTCSHSAPEPREGDGAVSMNPSIQQSAGDSPGGAAQSHCTEEQTEARDAGWMLPALTAVPTAPHCPPGP